MSEGQASEEIELWRIMRVAYDHKTRSFDIHQAFEGIKKLLNNTIDEISPNVQISDTYSGEDIETIVGGNINRVKGELKEKLHIT